MYDGDGGGLIGLCLHWHRRAVAVPLKAKTHIGILMCTMCILNELTQPITCLPIQTRNLIETKMFHCRHIASIHRFLKAVSTQRGPIPHRKCSSMLCCEKANLKMCPNTTSMWWLQSTTIWMNAHGNKLCSGNNTSMTYGHWHLLCRCS